MTSVQLVGLDFGTTTSSCIVATAKLLQNAVSGRRELTDIRETYRSELVFTPFAEQGLDESRLQTYLDTWLAAGNVRGDEIFGGGALLTGLAAQQKNSAILIELVRSRLGDALIAAAGDPCLEAWLAFQASAGPLSRANPQRWVVNLDIGGGTTNIALGKDGEVLRTGSLFVGARHVQFVPGTYQIVKLSDFARSLFDQLGIARGPGDCLDRTQVAMILDFYIDLLESAVAGDKQALAKPLGRLHQQVPFDPPGDVRDAIVTLSGGVGELVYGSRTAERLPSTTLFGDLGIDLAKRLIDSTRWKTHFETFVPACAGRATVYGLLLHTTQVSGSTLFLPDPTILPLRDLPIFGRVTPNSTEEQICDILQLVRRSPLGGCVQVVPADRGASAVAALGDRIAAALRTIGFPGAHPLVLLVRDNIAKALGHYVSQWGSMPLNLVVLDEIEIRDARFVQIGSAHNQVVPVSFYGMN
jgi:ethanolamine utilization protein EutA